LHLGAQTPAPAVPDNTLNSTNTIGLPPASSKEGTSEVVNLNNGALTFFLPAVTLPQRAGAAPLELGFTYDSNQINLQQNVSDSVAVWPDSLGGCNNTCVVTYDTFQYSVGTSQTTLTGGPLDLNIPQLSASLEYYGDWQYYYPGGSGGYMDAGPYFCMTNVAFRDWKGTTHAFPSAVIACDNESPLYSPIGQSYLVLKDNSSDHLFYHLDASNRSDYVVYAPDGTVYHFANPNLPCSPYKDFGLNCPRSSSVEQFINMPMTSSVDRFGNTITYSRDEYLTDTLGRTIHFNSDAQTGFSISYKDANGNQQIVTMMSASAAGLSDAQLQIPQMSSGLPDVGPVLQSNSCFINGAQNPPPSPQYSLEMESMPDGWTPPAQASGRQYSGWVVHYTSTGQSYILLFDYFGHLLKITYPEGGYHRYDYALYSPPALAQGPVTCSWPVAEVAHRYECTSSSGSCGQEAVTTYTPVVLGQSSNSQMTVVEPNGSITTHNFTRGVYSEASLTTLESDVYEYSPSNSLLRLTHNDYAPFVENGYQRPDLGAAYPFPIQVTTTLEDASPALSAHATISYDTVPLSTYFPYPSLIDPHIGNPISTYNYGYDGALNNSKTQSWYYLGYLANEPASTTTTDAIQGKQTTQTITHDSLGRITNLTISGTGVTPLSYNYTPDAWGRPTAIQDPNGNTTQYNYSNSSVDNNCPPGSPNSFLTSVTNAANQITTYKPYSCTGQFATSLDPNGVTVSLNYDGASRIVQRQVTSSSGIANSLTVSYQDGPGSTITRTEAADPDPSIVTQYSLDGIGRVIQQSMLSDPIGVTTIATTFNPMGQVQAVTNPYRSASDPTYGITSYLYDALGRKTYQCQPDNGGFNTAACAPSTSYLHWVYSGKVVSSSDETGRRWQRTTDAFGRLTNVAELGSSSQPLNLQTSYTYDGFGNLLTVSQNGQSGDAPRQQRGFTYDALSRLVCASNPENSTAACPSSSGAYVAGTTGYGYTINGSALCAGDHTLPCSKTDARGVTTNYAYDNLNRLHSKTYTNAPAGSMSSCFAYDITSIGRLAAEWTQAGPCLGSAPTSGFQTLRKFQAYDAMGRITSEQQCVPSTSGQGTCTASTQYPFALTYGYDMAGNLAQYTNGINTIMFTLQYDGAGRLSMLTSTWSDSLHPPTLFTANPANGYTAEGGIQNMILGNSIFVTKTYDNRLRTTGETATRP